MGCRVLTASFQRLRAGPRVSLGPNPPLWISRNQHNSGLGRPQRSSAEIGLTEPCRQVDDRPDDSDKARHVHVYGPAVVQAHFRVVGDLREELAQLGGGHGRHPAGAHGAPGP